MRWLDGISSSIDMNLSKFWEMVKDREAWCAAVRGLAALNSTERLNKSSQWCHLLARVCTALTHEETGYVHMCITIYSATHP